MLNYEISDERTDEWRPVFTHSMQVIPISPPLTAWLALGEDVEGPYPIIAMAQRITTVQCRGVVEMGIENHSVKHHELSEHDYRDPLRYSTSDDMPFPAPLYHVVAPESGYWDSPWVEAEYVYFSEAAARNALVRFAEAARRRQEREAQRELAEAAR